MLVMRERVYRNIRTTGTRRRIKNRAKHIYLYILSNNEKRFCKLEVMAE